MSNGCNCHQSSVIHHIGARFRFRPRMDHRWMMAVWISRNRSESATWWRDDGQSERGHCFDWQLFLPRGWSGVCTRIQWIGDRVHGSVRWLAWQPLPDGTHRVRGIAISFRGMFACLFTAAATTYNITPPPRSIRLSNRLRRGGEAHP